MNKLFFLKKARRLTKPAAGRPVNSAKQISEQIRTLKSRKARLEKQLAGLQARNRAVSRSFDGNNGYVRRPQIGGRYVSESTAREERRSLRNQTIALEGQRSNINQSIAELSQHPLRHVTAHEGPKSAEQRDDARESARPGNEREKRDRQLGRRHARQELLALFQANTDSLAGDEHHLVEISIVSSLRANIYDAQADNRAFDRELRMSSLMETAEIENHAHDYHLERQERDASTAAARTITHDVEAELDRDAELEEHGGNYLRTRPTGKQIVTRARGGLVARPQL